MRRVVLAVLASCLSVVPTGASRAAPPPGAISSNVDFVTNIPQAQQAISLNFIGDTMFVSGVDGVQSYDVSNPRDPQLLGVLPMYIWENEDVDVDPARHLLFISRDPRGFTSPATSGATFPYGMLQVIDVSNPRAMIEISQIVLGSGHTSTCVAKCRWIWTGGPFANAQTQPSWHGRPIMSTDLSDPMNPKACPHPINLGNNDGLTDYSHDVQVDAAGVAWVSGFGSVRGFWVTGRHRDPVDGRVKTATGCDPIPYAGGGTELGRGGGIMHNAGRNLQAKVDGRRGDVLWVTEENLTTACATTGRFSTYDLRGSYQGQGFKNIAKTKFRLKQLGTWSIEKQPGSNGCDSCGSRARAAAARPRSSHRRWIDVHPCVSRLPQPASAGCAPSRRSPLVSRRPSRLAASSLWIRRTSPTKAVSPSRNHRRNISAWSGAICGVVRGCRMQQES
ncbi:MAG: hypothetical protein LC640_13455 [Frankia sp.]|nr:hypothetical protein [Frankia sp.]